MTRSLSISVHPRPLLILSLFFFFFFNDTATTEIYTLSLHDALPISRRFRARSSTKRSTPPAPERPPRSEEHTSELQSHDNLVCRLLLEKKQSHSLRLTARSPSPPSSRDNTGVPRRRRRGARARRRVVGRWAHARVTWLVLFFSMAGRPPESPPHPHPPPPRP